MRVSLGLPLAAAVLATAAVVPAVAIEKTVHVPVLHCEIYVETNDVSVGANSRGLRFERRGYTAVSTNC